ncbi:MAG: outer membrane protein assembly factor BamD [Phycisphaerales bacterium]
MRAASATFGTLLLLMSATSASGQGTVTGPSSPPAGTAVGTPLTRPTYTLGDAGTGWQQAEAPEPGSDGAVIADARRALAEERAGAAKSILDRFIEKNERGKSPLLPQAYLLRADATSLAGDEFEALYDYETVIKTFAATPEFALAVERELEIAVRYVNGLERKLFGYRIVDASDIGEELLIRVQERMPGSRLAERAGIELADFYYREREMELASDAYDLFLINYPQSTYRSKAMQRRIYANIARFKGPAYDSKPLVDAAVLIARYQNQFPAQAAEAGLDEALLTRIDESGGQQMLISAKWYLTQSDPVSARYTMQRLLKRHPQTAAAAEAATILQARGWSLDSPKGTTPMPVPGAEKAKKPAAKSGESPAGGAGGAK